MLIFAVLLMLASLLVVALGCALLVGRLLVACRDTGEVFEESAEALPQRRAWAVSSSH